MNNLKIEKNNWILKVSLDGGRIKDLKYKDEIILGTFERIDGKTANTHICAPNFGNEGIKKFSLPFHGPFRNERWNLISKTDDKMEIESIVNDLKVIQSFELSDSFSQKISVENLSQEAKIVNIAIHNYWDSINGWYGTRLNGMVIDNLIMSDVGEGIGRENIVEIPGKMSIKWSFDGFKNCQFWTGVKEENSRKKYDQKYVCLEPSLEKQGFLDNGENNLEAGEKLELGQRIGVVCPDLLG